MGKGYIRESTQIMTSFSPFPFFGRTAIQEYLTGTSYRPEIDLYGRVADDGTVSGAGRVCPAAVVGRFVVTVQVLM